MTSPDFIYDDEYTGPRWTYGLRYRPLGTGAVPRGWIIGSLREPTSRPARFPHGTVDYPRELTGAEVAGYELARVSRYVPATTLYWSDASGYVSVPED